MKDYFGERIGMYFLFLQEYVTWLMPVAFTGAVTYIGMIFCSIVIFPFLCGH